MLVYARAYVRVMLFFIIGGTMMTYQRILCPFNVHNPNDTVLQSAVVFCGGGGTVYVLYVIEDVTGFGMGEQYSLLLKPSPEEYKAIRKAIVGVISHYIPASMKIVPVIRRGNLAHCIIDEARQKFADLIVLSRRKLSTVEELLFHSSTDAVVHNAPCPVFIVRNGVPPRGAKKYAENENQWMEV